MPHEDVNVSVADDHLHRFDEVVRGLRKAGLKVQQQLEAVGVVSGSIDSDQVEGLEKTPGVAAVERSRAIRIAPPESDVQ
jgi:hypothetical protein